MWTIEALFQFLSYSPGLFWLGLMFRPKDKRFQIALDVYLWLIISIFAIRALPAVPAMLPLIANPTFDAMRAAMQTPEGFVSSWNHFIIGDLWFGRYIASDCEERGLSALVRVAFIFLTMFFGPMGLFCYLLVRGVLRRDFRIGSAL